LNIFIIASFTDFDYNELTSGYYNSTEYNNITGKYEIKQIPIDENMRWDKRMYQPTLFKRDDYTGKIKKKN
jgi:hypothetical protein